MPSLGQQIHRDKALENISVMYNPQGFVADTLAPAVKVKHESDIYYVYGREAYQLEETIRADDAESNRASFNVSISSYNLEEHALHDDVTDRMKENADKAIDPEIDTTEALTRKIMVRREYDLSQIIQSTANWSNNASLTSTYAFTQNTTLSNPITSIDSASAAIVGACGMKPNLICMDYSSFMGAKEHVSIIDRTKYTSADSVNELILARLFNVDSLVVAMATYEGSEEGIATTTGYGFIWTNATWVAYVEKNPGLRKASAIYRLTQVSDGSPYVVKKWREEKKGADVIEVSTKYCFKPIATACAYLLRDTA